MALSEFFEHLEKIFNTTSHEMKLSIDQFHVSRRTGTPSSPAPIRHRRAGLIGQKKVLTSSSGNNEQKDLSDKYKKLVMEVGDVWKTFKDFLSLFQKRYINKISIIQSKCFEKDAICLDAIKKVGG